MNGIDGFMEDAAIVGYASLPTLEQSENPDVARFARAANEISSTILRRVLIVRAISMVAFFALIPYWFGCAAALIESHLTGVLVLFAVPFLGIAVPAMLAFSKRLPVRLTCALLVIAGAIWGVVALRSGVLISPATGTQ